jgi:hypothetical protein
MQIHEHGSLCCVSLRAVFGGMEVQVPVTLRTGEKEKNGKY